MIAKAQRERSALPPGNSTEHRTAFSPEVPEASLAPSRRDEILAKVTHELRTPLASILMATGFVLEDLLPPHPGTTLRRQLEAIHRAARMMARLVDDLLDASTHASGRLVLVRAPLRAADLFTRAYTLLHPLAAARHITLTFTQEQGLVTFSADEGRLLQVITNLVGNAIKFCEPGGQIRVSACPEPHCISFRVADSGAGIAAADLAHVFDRYWQAPAARHIGVGLGLAIAREIVDGHGGRIDASSTVGAGTVFVFTIPC